MLCINCNLEVGRMHRHNVSSLPQPLQSILAEWLNTQQLPSEGVICHACYVCLNGNPEELPSGSRRLLGHNMICIGCGKSVLNKRHNKLIADNPLLTIIRSWNTQNQELRNESYVCYACWQRANRHRRLNQPPEVEQAIPAPLLPPPVIPPPVLPPPVVPPPVLSPPVLPPPVLPPPVLPPPVLPPPVLPPPVLPPVLRQMPPTLTLPHYKRAANTSRRCIFNGCNSNSFHMVPTFIKAMLIKECKYYIPISCRVCETHLYSDDWHVLPDNSTCTNNFTAYQIENLIEIANRHLKIFDFENVMEMPNHICYYWTGRTVLEFMALYQEIPALLEIKHAKTALSMYLVKLRTGDSNERLSSLYKVARSTLESYMDQVRLLMDQNFVPSHIGLQHITVQEIVQRNLSIPSAFFGNENMPPESRPAIVLCDGTYLYVQKSSNYLYQKKTYSLHKYNNLVKPFIIVSCDGHIIDVLGPYPATKSDAEIMRDLFGDENGPFRRYFRANDVIILDRGFRDVIPLLESYGYKVYKPENIEEGQTQLTTLQANKSRCVTMCRWVVEIVNGRFKRDFKLFRQEYFNKASKHMMMDFRIAAALINRFHPVIQDRPDAHYIIQRALQYMNVPNYLAQFVSNFNLNRRRAIFTRIDANLPQLNSFPVFEYNDLIMLSLGTYHIKEARSYYGEHIRESGIYEIEVCPELEQSDEMVAHVGGNEPYLLRSRIKSRHVSHLQYYSYLLVDRMPSSRSSLDAILGYCCSCKAGNRTVGCCSHIMTIVWYLGWARYQNNLEPPARFLDDILV